MTWLSRPCADLGSELQFSLMMVVTGILFLKFAGSQTCAVLIVNVRCFRVSSDYIIMCEDMEGLIPFIYRLIIRFRSGEHRNTNGFWFDEPHLAAPYVRLAGGSQVPSENSSSTS
ncbi:hypothetical protein V6N13_056232 [Hibiscus sabdariffa]